MWTLLGQGEHSGEDIGQIFLSLYKVGSLEIALTAVVVICLLYSCKSRYNNTTLSAYVEVRYLRRYNHKPSGRTRTCGPMIPEGGTNH